MSCGQPTEDEQLRETIPVVPQPSKECVRCKLPPKIVVRATAWCHDCFLASFQGRFRKNLESAKLVSRSGFDVYEGIVDERAVKGKPRNDLSTVVLAFSGGASSRAMLELFKTSYYKNLLPPSPEHPTAASPRPVPSASTDLPASDPPSEGVKSKKKKKPVRLPQAFGECVVVFIDESEVPGYGDDRTDEVRQIVESTTPFRFHPVKLSSVFAPSASTSTSTDSACLSTSLSSASLPSHASSTSTASGDDASSHQRDQLLSLLSPSSSSSSSSSSRPSSISLSATTSSTLHSTLVHSLLLSTAESLGAEVLLVGDSLTRVGVKVIQTMSQGMGASMGEIVASEHVHRFPVNRPRPARSNSESNAPGPNRTGSPERRGTRGDSSNEIDADEDEKKLLVVRPMGAALAKEVAYYVETEGLARVAVPNEETRVGFYGVGKGDGPGRTEKDIKKVGIGKLVEDFVLSLESQFPSTCSIISRTAHKLGLRSAIENIGQTPAAVEHESSEVTSAEEKGTKTRRTRRQGWDCAFCRLPAQPNADGWRSSITISDLTRARTLLESSRADRPTKSSLLGNPTSEQETRGQGGNEANGTAGRRKPYQPSANHLLSGEPDSTVQDVTPAPPSSAAEVSNSSTTASENAKAGATSDAGPDLGRAETIDLSRHLCYACLLLFQTIVPPSTTPNRATVSSSRRPGGALSTQGGDRAPAEVTLPPYVREMVEHRLRHDETFEGRREGMRREIEDYLL